MPITPKSAPAFRDSVGVVTHIVYYDTAYGNWPTVVARLRRAGRPPPARRRLRQPGADWRDWNERYYRRSSSPPRAACASTSAWASPGNRGRHARPAPRASRAAGCATPPRRSRRRTSSTSTSAARGWPSRLSRLQPRPVPQGQGAARRCARCRSSGPSFATPDGASRVGRPARAGSTSATSTPTPAASPPTRARARRAARARSAVSGRKPVWATEAGFHNAMRATAGPAAGVRGGRGGLPAAHLPRALRPASAAPTPTSCSTRSPIRRGATPSSTSACCATTSAASRPSRRSEPADARRPRRRRPRGCARCACASRGPRRRAPARAAEGRRHLPRRALALGSVWDRERRRALRCAPRAGRACACPARAG